MRNIILVGNGFDLSHDLKTKYSHFVENSNKSDFALIKRYKIIDPPKGYSEDAEKAYPNKLYQEIIDTQKDLWCDIERVYFEELLISDNPNNLNEEFETIKLKFEDYLIDETKDVNKIESYNNIFKRFPDKPYLINFNYTSTAKLYKDHFSEIIHIHGELNNKDNPIIFGYAADEENTLKLLNKKDDNYLKNIKQYEYQGTTNFRRILEILEGYKKINVFLIGLSCGLSDKLILKKILGHENVRQIFNLYFSNRRNHLSKLMNINRIISEDEGFLKFAPLPNCLRIPQFNKPIEQHEIDEFFKVNKKYGL